MMTDRIAVRPLKRLSAREMSRLEDGYVSDVRYEVRWSDRADRTAFSLHPVLLQTPFHKVFPHPADELARYRKVVRLGWSVGAYQGTRLVGLALAEPRAWNRSVKVWELDVAASHRRRGIGTCLVKELERKARKEGFRTIVCETQTTNGPALAFYRSAGFRIEGIDVSYYTNEDLHHGEVALFMKRRVVPRERAPRASREPRRRTSK